MSFAERPVKVIIDVSGFSATSKDGSPVLVVVSQLLTNICLEISLGSAGKRVTDKT